MILFLLQNFSITPSTSQAALVQHLYWLDASIAKTLSIDEIIQHVVHDEETKDSKWSQAIENFDDFSNLVMKSILNVSLSIILHIIL